MSAVTQIHRGQVTSCQAQSGQTGCHRMTGLQLRHPQISLFLGQSSVICSPGVLTDLPTFHYPKFLSFKVIQMVTLVKLHISKIPFQFHEITDVLLRWGSWVLLRLCHQRGLTEGNSSQDSMGCCLHATSPNGNIEETNQVVVPSSNPQCTRTSFLPYSEQHSLPLGHLEYKIVFKGKYHKCSLRVALVFYVFQNNNSYGYCD